MAGRAGRIVYAVGAVWLCLASGSAGIELRSSHDIAQASRGAGRFTDDPPGTVYTIRNGIYRLPEGLDALIWAKVGGTAEKKRRFVGESRNGVIIHGRATVTADHVEICNMTFDLRGYTPRGKRSFSTVSIVGASHVSVCRVDCLGNGDKGRRGGHIEVRAPNPESVPAQILVEDCFVEGFGIFAEKEGRLAHGIYIGEGRQVTVRNCEIRRNSGRGIQIFSHFPDARMLQEITIEGNLIHYNGKEKYTDGIVIGSVRSREGDVVSGVTIRDNVIHHNTFAGLRIATNSCEAIEVLNNTFWANSRSFRDGAGIWLDSRPADGAVVVKRSVFVEHRGALRSPRGSRPEASDNLVIGPVGDLEGGVSADRGALAPAAGRFSIDRGRAGEYGARGEFLRKEVSAGDADPSRINPVSE
jgi:hypothetical protein